MDQMNRQAPIGMFDSGVGGISVLREAVRLLPHERFLFYGDTAHAPYGTKDKAEVLRLSRQVVETLLARGAKAIVIACNTATSAAAAALRAHRDGIVLSLATPGTIAGEKYAHLYSLYGEGVVSLPCPGLMDFVERGELGGECLNAYLDRLFAPYRGGKVEAIVLGCTHYVFLKSAVARFFPQVPLIDGNEGTVRQLKRRLEERGLLAPEEAIGGTELISSGGNAEIMRTLLQAPENA